MKLNSISTSNSAYKQKLNYFYHYFPILLLISFFLITSASCQPNFDPSELPIKWDPTSVTIRYTWPDDTLDATQWAGYGIFLVLLFILPLIGGCCLCCSMIFIWCGRKCKLCLGSSPKEKHFHKSARVIAFVPYLVLFSLLVITGLIGMIFSSSFWGSSVSITESSFNTFNSAVGLVDVVGDEIRGTFGKVDGIVSKISSSISQVQNRITQPIDSITSMMNNEVIPEISNINNTLTLISSNISSIVTINNALLQRKELENQTSSIPDISSFENFNTLDTFTDQIRDSVNSITSQKDQLTSNFNSMINQVTDLINNGNKMIKKYSNETEKYLGIIKEQMEKYIGTKEQRDVYKGYANSVQYTVMFFVIIFFACSLLIYATGILYYFCGASNNFKAIQTKLQEQQTEDSGEVTHSKKKKNIYKVSYKLSNCCIKLLACYSFVFLIGFFLLVSIQLTAVGMVSGFCDGHKKVINQFDSLYQKILNFTGTPDPLQQFNIKVSFSNVTNQVLTCRGETTLLDISGFTLDQFNITSMFDTYINQINNTLNNFDFNGNGTGGNIKKDILDRFNEFTSFLSDDDKFNLQKKYQSNITQIENILDQTVNTQLQELNRFNFSETEYTSSLDTINQKSQQVGGPYYTEQNITLLDPNSYPFNQSQALKDEMTNYKNQFLDLQKKLNETLELIEEIRTNITQIKYHFNFIKNDLNSTFVVVDKLRNQIPQRVLSEINSLFDFADEVKGNATSILQLTVSLIKDVLTFDKFAKCDWIGNFYSSVIETQLCTNLTVFTFFITVAELFIGILMFLFYLNLLELSKVVGLKIKLRMSGVKRVEQNISTNQSSYYHHSEEHHHHHYYPSPNMPIDPPPVDYQHDPTYEHNFMDNGTQNNFVEMKDQEDELVHSDNDNNNKNINVDNDDENSSFDGNIGETNIYPPPPPPPPPTVQNPPTSNTTFAEDGIAEIEPDLNVNISQK